MSEQGAYDYDAEFQRIWTRIPILAASQSNRYVIQRHVVIGEEEYRTEWLLAEPDVWARWGEHAALFSCDEAWQVVARLRAAGVSGVFATERKRFFSDRMSVVAE